jgi:hypothetical protein
LIQVEEEPRRTKDSLRSGIAAANLPAAPFPPLFHGSAPEFVLGPPLVQRGGGMVAAQVAEVWFGSPDV